jgi:hypothetical protein
MTEAKCENDKSIPAASTNVDQKLENLIQSIIVDPDADVEEPPTVICVNDVPVCTLGNFSLLIGKAKSRKTFLVASFTAAAISGSCSIECISGTMPPDSEVHYFDTEQSTFHLHRTVNRIIAQTGGDKLKVYEMRPLPTSVRLQVIEYVIERLSVPTFIIIDGLRDLMANGINDEAEATIVISKLLKWTHYKDCHIMLVLHQNKNDANARGHIGTEAVNKAETVFRLNKEKDITRVLPEFCRDIEFEEFSFYIDQEGRPVCTKSKRDVHDANHHEMLTKMFKKNLADGASLSHGVLKKKIMMEESVSDPTAKRRITEAFNADIIVKNKKNQYMLRDEENNAEEVTV